MILSTGDDGTLVSRLSNILPIEKNGSSQRHSQQ